MSKFKYIILGMLLGMFIPCTAVFAQSQIKLIVNGKEVQSDVAPQTINGRTMIPARALAEALGATVAWDAQENAITITSNGVKQSTIGNMPDTLNKHAEQIVEEDTVQNPGYFMTDKEYSNIKSMTTTYEGLPALNYNGQVYFDSSEYNSAYNVKNGTRWDGYKFDSGNDKNIYFVKYVDDSIKKKIITQTILVNRDNCIFHSGTGVLFINTKYFIPIN